MIRPLSFADIPAASALVASGMRDNPLNIAAMGPDPGRVARLQRLFTVALPLIVRKGMMLGAFEDQRLVGVAGSLPPGHCQPSITEAAGMLPGLVAAAGLGRIARFGRWLHEWKSRDLHEPHWHLGPVAVDTRRQGHGIGSALLEEYRALLDRTGAIGYLETDKPENIAFYEKFGFRVIGKAQVLGTTNWFMRG
jgi:GNAT superfamily N-acetyltransferase